MKKPRVTLVVSVACVVAFGLVGLAVEQHLRPTSLAISGTDSAEGEALARSHFGDSVPFVVLLQGPTSAVDRQGPSLAAALRRKPTATVVSPWGGRSLARLRLGPRRALILVDVHESLDRAIEQAAPWLEEVVAAHSEPPLRVSQSGFAAISRALQQESLAASKRAELYAAPLLILILLLVFRSAIAALLPLLFGVAAVLVGRGVLVLLASFMQIDALSLVVCTMMGLALGVDYSLLIVSRFREELAVHPDARRAALRTRRSAGRTTILAGATLFISILAAAFVAPGSLLVSLAIALVVVTAISILIAWWVLPALLALLGERVNSLPIGRVGARGRSRAAAVAAAALRQPVRSAALILVPLLLLAAPALAFNTGAPGVDELPASSAVREDAETIARVAGPGWEAPFVLLAASSDGPITTDARLAALAEWQRETAGWAGVDAVIGPAPIERASRSLRTVGRRFNPDGRSDGERLEILGSRLVRASRGVERLRGGLAEASAGSGLLGSGADRAHTGAGQISSSLRSAAGRGRLAAERLTQLHRGAKQLSGGQRQAEATAFTLRAGVATVLEDVGKGGLPRARRLAAELNSAARVEQALRPQAERAVILARLVAASREELQRLRRLATTLGSGLERLSAGGRRLEDGAARLAGAAEDGETKLLRLGSGADRLDGGLAELRDGAVTLEGGLAGATRRAQPLQAGLHRTGRQLTGSARLLTQQEIALKRMSPGIFDSGYLALSALDGAKPSRRALAEEVVSIAAGGRATRMLVVPSAALNSPGSRALQDRLVTDAEQFSSAAGLKTGLAGGAAVLNDYGAATRASLPLVIGSMVLVTFAMLVTILRAPILASLTILLNLVSVGAAMGVVSLLCRVPAGFPLGGHPYIDTVGAAAIFGVTFGLSIDYAVFLIARMRERREQGGSNQVAIDFGLERTAGLITGAAAIMAVVFAAFAAAPVATVSQMGVGLTVAILIDATVVRIVLLPAVMLILGERVWWVPSWLDRLLPRLNVEGEPAPSVQTVA